MRLLCVGALLLLPHGIRCEASASSTQSPWSTSIEEDEESQRCDGVVNEFSFGIYFREMEDGEFELARDDPATNSTVLALYDDYEQCVHRLRLLDRSEDAKPRSFAVGRHHPNLLIGPNAKSGFTLLPALDFVVSAFVKLYGTYDELEQSILSRLLNENDTAIEVGANIGVYSVVMAEALGPGGFLYAFEPFRKVFQILTANIALNGFGNVQTYQAGVGRRAERTTIRVPSLANFTNLGAARVFLQQESHVANVPYDPQMETIEVKRLDDMEWPRRIDFIKIDAEGMEEDVIAGAEQLLLRDLPMIYAESQPYFFDNDRSFVELVRGYGYSCIPIKGLEVHHLLLCVHETRWEEFTRTSRLLRG